MFLWNVISEERLSVPALNDLCRKFADLTEG